MARKSIYPPSVTPGIPKLGEKPEGWIETTFGKVLQAVERKAEVEDDAEYQLVTAKRNRGGIVPREKLFGRDILTKTQFFIKTDDFLISRRQIIHGACGVVPPELDGALVSNEYAALRVKDGLLLDFLSFLCHTVYFQQTCFQASVGVDVEKMVFSLSDWLTTEIYLPSPPEQRRIVDILGTWDQAIDLIEQRIEAARQRKKALLQQLLSGQSHFGKVARSVEKRETKLGRIPADWKTVPVQKIGAVNSETLGSQSDPDRKYLYIDLASVNQGRITMPPKRQRLEGLPSRARRVLHKHDVIMATVRPHLLGFAVCNFDPLHVLCSTGFALISPKNQTDSEFIYQSLYSDAVLRQLHGLVMGSNYPAINASEVKSLMLIWPKTAEERKQIANVLEDSDAEIDLLRRKLSSLRRQKKGLMQRLLTGRVRV